MIITDYYFAQKTIGRKTRYDIIHSSGSYEYFEHILVNKKEPNVGGHSLYIVDRPARWGNRWERQSDKAITKSTMNISSIIIPDPEICLGYGDVNSTNDALIIEFSPDWTYVEIFVARGLKNNKLNIYQLVVDGELDEEMESFRNKMLKDYDEN